VEIVEASPGAVADLRANLQRSGLGHVRVIEGDVEEVLKSRSVARPDLVLLDPPRSGLSSAATDEIIALAAPRIVYLSCDPATLARDTARLRDGGYSLESIQGFDLFPQTPHVEALAVLVPTVGPQG
jgi:23S rRNA (uracil1939-C5)-methyltransferase